MPSGAGACFAARAPSCPPSSIGCSRAARPPEGRRRGRQPRHQDPPLALQRARRLGLPLTTPDWPTPSPIRAGDPALDQGAYRGGRAPCSTATPTASSCWRLPGRSQRSAGARLWPRLQRGARRLGPRALARREPAGAGVRHALRAPPPPDHAAGRGGPQARYAGLAVSGGAPRVEFTGMEAVRRDGTELGRTVQREALRAAFHDRGWWATSRRWWRGCGREAR